MKLLLIAGMILITGCTAKIDIVGEGDVLSESGARNCYLETPDCSEVVVGAFKEYFTAVPRDGWRFVGWEYCQMAIGPICGFDLAAETVQLGWNKQLPAVVAHFEPVEPAQGLVMESFTATVHSCSLTEQLRYEASCAPLIGKEISLSIVPDNDYLHIGGYVSSVYNGHYNETADGWVFTGVTEYGAADWVETIVRSGDEIVISQSVRQTDGGAEKIGYNRTTVSTIN